MTLADLDGFLESYRGGISVEEGLALSRFAEICVNRVIVEIGSFKGKSAIALAYGQARSRFAKEGLVYCIDPHLPFVGFYGGTFGVQDRRDFYTIMLKTGCFDRVCLVNLKSEAASKGWNQQIGLLFIDGDHNVEGVRSDVFAWERHVAVGGTIIFDDAVDPGAGAKHAIENLLSSGRFERVDSIGKMIVIRKLAVSADTLQSEGPRRILVACHNMVVAGGLFRFERFGRVIQPFGHHLAFMVLGDASRCVKETEFPVLTFEQASHTFWDVTVVPGAGFPLSTIDRFSDLMSANFGLRVQHVLNDLTHKPRFLHVNRRFNPDIVIFNNRHWRPGDFTEFQAKAFYFLEGAVDVETLAPDPRRCYGPRSKPFVVGGLANKNVGPLIDAIRLCDKDVHLQLFGSSDEVRKRAGDLLDAERISFLGVLGDHELPQFYAGVDCIAHTETIGGWANLAAEAMACGVTLICTSQGTSAFAEHETTALVVTEPTPAALADAIRRLQADSSLAGHLAHNARQRIQRFSWTSYAAELLRLMRQPAASYYTWSPDLGLFGKWPEEERLVGLETVLDDCVGKTVCDLGSGEGVIARRLLERGASLIHGFDREESRVELARQICSKFKGADFWKADLSNWDVFEAEQGSLLRETYDIVLYLGLHHHLPPTSRKSSLAGIAKRASDRLVVRTPKSHVVDDDIENFLASEGFQLVATNPSRNGSRLSGVYIFRRVV